MSLVDIHTHIDYYNNYEKVYNEYNKLNIYTLFVTNLPEIYEKCLDTFSDSKYIRISLGYNPQMVKEQKFNRELFEKYLMTTKYIGEVGLDFSKQFVDYKNKQINILKYICNCISKNQKIISVHSRKSERNVLDILETNNIKFAIFHWYSGTIPVINRIIENGYYFSVNYSMLNNEKGRKILNEIPLNKLFIESDGPFTEYRKNIFYPKNLKKVYNEFENYYGVNDLKNIIISNLNSLLNKYNSFIKS
ncbi:MAG: TatD family hydrolase [bacterium]